MSDVLIPKLDESFFESLNSVPNVRSAQFVDVEMVESASGYSFDGLAAPTGITADLGEFTEEYQRGSFRRFLAACKDNIPFLHEHHPRDLMATTRSGRLKLGEDGRGLRAKADVVRTDLSERVKALVDSGDIRGMSIGMVVGRGNADVELREGRPHRTILNFRKILDVCTTFDPAYATTEAQFRSLTMQYADSPASLQQLLMGAYPQLREQGMEVGDTPDEAPADGSAPDEDVEPKADDATRVDEPQERSLAARKRELELFILTTGGLTDET